MHWLIDRKKEEREIDKQINNRDRDWEMDKNNDIYRWIDKQTDRYIDRQIDRLIHRYSDIYFTHIDK